MSDPLHVQTTPWIGLPGKTMDLGEGVLGYWFRRSIPDGSLMACVSEEPQGWHLSISYRDRAGQYTRYPSWDEIAHARYELLPADLDFVMHLPPPEQYVAVHLTTFHLHEHPERT